MFSFDGTNFIYVNNECTCYVLENLDVVLYVVIGFAISYLALEGAWHFTACRIKDKPITPCIFKQVKTKFITSSRIS